MNAFLWTFLVVGLFGAGANAVYVMTGATPKRTRLDALVSLITWAAWVAWAAYLLAGEAK